MHRSICFFFLAMFVAVFCCGCGDEDPGDPNLDLDAEYALDVKKDVLDFTEAWPKKQKSESTKVSLQMLVEKLSAYESMPTGDYEDVYEQLLAQTKEMQDNYTSVTADQINQLKQTAEKLPGDPASVKYDPN